MGETKDQIKRSRSGMGRGWWLALWGIALVALAFFGGANAGAAPVNQTVPGRTPTSEPTPVPTVTAVPPTNTPLPPPPPPTNTPQPNATATPTPDRSAPTATPSPTGTATLQPSPTAVPDFGLLLKMEALPPLVSQGQELALRFLVSNPGNVAAVNAQVRNELPPALRFVESAVGEGGSIAVERAGGRTVLLIRWPSLAAGDEVEAVIRVTVAPATPNGTVIDNLAVAWADNAAAYTAGISIGMPPALLPTFE